MYEGALYVEEETAAAELRRLQAEGFFRQGDYSTDRLCAALAAANATRVVQLRLLRSITGKQFTDALSESLAPRVAGTGELTLPTGCEHLKCTPLAWLYREQLTRIASRHILPMPQQGQCVRLPVVGTSGITCCLIACPSYGALSLSVIERTDGQH